MKKTIVTLLMAASPAVFSQAYNATVNDLNTIFNPPSNIQGIICQKTDSDNISHSGTACRDGVAAARWMAEKYAKKAGKYLGCIDGFYQGIWDGFQMGVNPTPEMVREAQAYVAQSVMQTAVESAVTRANQSASTESADQIIRRYRAVIDQAQQGNQVLPDKSPNMPAITFDGFDNGYESDIGNGTVRGGSFREAIEAGYIKSNSPFRDKIAARRAHRLQGENVRSLCDINQTIFGRRGLPQLTIWDYFRAKRTRDFQKYGWKNGSWAWDVYDKDETNLDHYQNFKGLSNKVVTVEVPVYKTVNKLDASGKVIPVLNEDGTPKVNSDGSPAYETEQVFSHNRSETRKVNDSELKVLRAEYKKSFVDAYNVYYAKQYASVEYHQEGISKYDHAKILGKFIGQDVAQNTAKKDAYDARYKLVSAKAYAEEAEKLYLASFKRLIDIFENNPVVELNDARVIGTTNDGIYRAGEQLSVALSVTNLGEVARPVTLRIDNSVDIIANQNGHQFTPASLTRTDLETGIIGSISNDVRARENISVSMNLDNPSNLNEIATELVISKTEGLVVREYTEINSSSSTLNFLTGKVDTKVVLVNPSDVETPAFPKVRVSNSITNNTIEKNGLKIAGGNTQDLLVTITDLDPMQIIAKSGVTITTESLLSNKITHKVAKHVNLALSDDNAYATYFDALITNQTSNTGSDSKSIRIGKVIGKIESSLNSTLRNSKVRWRKQADVDYTIVGSLQRSYSTTKAKGLLTNEVKKKYSEVAHLLAKKVNNKGSSRVRGTAKNYLKQLKKFAPKLSTKARSHR